MRNIEKGQHIFIAFQNGKAVLDSQLRPRMYISRENADKWTPTVDKGKIEYVEYAPIITPPNEAERAGSYRKYTVCKNKDCPLFYITPSEEPEAVAALRAYAATIDNADLDADLINWVRAEPNEPMTIEQLLNMDGQPGLDSRLTDEVCCEE